MMSTEAQNPEDNLRRLSAEGDLDAARRLITLAARRQDAEDVARGVEALRHAETETDTETMRLMLRSLNAVGLLDTMEAILFELEPDLPDLDAEQLARHPVAEYERWELRVWKLPEELGGHTFLETRDPTVSDVLLRPTDQLERTFGGVSAAVGAVPLGLLLLRDEALIRLYDTIIEDIHGELIPEAYRDELDKLVAVAREHSGCGEARGLHQR